MFNGRSLNCGLDSAELFINPDVPIVEKLKEWYLYEREEQLQTSLTRTFKKKNQWRLIAEIL